MLVAHLDRKENAIVVDHCDYTALTLFLNDNMLNLDKPVKVLFAGRELFNGPVERNAKTMRRNLLSREDLYQE